MNGKTTQDEHEIAVWAKLLAPEKRLPEALALLADAHLRDVSAQHISVGKAWAAIYLERNRRYGLSDEDLTCEDYFGDKPDSLIRAISELSQAMTYMRTGGCTNQVEECLNAALADITYLSDQAAKDNIELGHLLLRLGKAAGDLPQTPSDSGEQR